jgi:hypothetical protein
VASTVANGSPRCGGEEDKLLSCDVRFVFEVHLLSWGTSRFPTPSLSCRDDVELENSLGGEVLTNNFQDNSECTAVLRWSGLAKAIGYMSDDGDGTTSRINCRKMSKLDQSMRVRESTASDGLGDADVGNTI